MKKLILLLLPFLLFAEEHRFKQGDQYIYDVKYGIIEGNTRCFQIIYDVLSVDEQGTALISCDVQGARPHGIIGYQYNVFITPEKKISLEKPWSCFCGKYNRYAQSQVENFLFPLDFYRKNKGSNFFQDGNFYSFEVRETIHCKDSVNAFEVVMDSHNGLPLQFRVWDEGELCLEISRRDQSE